MARRRKARHGDGSYRQRGRNAWQLRWMEDGVAQTETVHGSEDDARVRLKRVTADAAEGLIPARVMQRTVGDILQWRLNRYEVEQPASLKTIRSFVARLVDDEIASIRVVKVRKSDIDRLRNRLLQRGLAGQA